jgi:hypothetical protein
MAAKRAAVKRMMKSDGMRAGRREVKWKEWWVEMERANSGERGRGCSPFICCA